MQKEQQQLAELVKGKKVAFIGAGVSHKTLIEEFVGLGAQVTLCDKKNSVEDFGDYADTIRRLGIDLSLGEHYMDGFKGQDIILRTPGFEYYQKPLQDAIAAGTMVTSEVELFFDYCPCEIVGVTGSDGKTTTTTLISKFYEAAGRKVHLGGNIGAALLPMLPDVAPEDVAVVELSSFQIDNFYKKNIEEINGKYYMQVAKFDDSVKVYNALGATDMELCAVNMVGSAKFDEILNQPRTKTLSSQELATYFMSKPNVFTIKKRGSLDWTFKYSSKSFGIIRENDDSYKVSIKCYPDAAQRINDVYKALEDSNFPSGPLWYCFNELRNLPPRVCKWLVDTSCQISQFQQIKTDKLKDTIKTTKDYDIDIADIRTKFQAGEKVLKFPKFTMIFSKGNDADMTTYLTRECEGVDASAYTKEYYYKFADGVNSVSILCPTKGLSEDVIIAIFDEIEKIAK